MNFYVFFFDLCFEVFFQSNIETRSQTPLDKVKRKVGVPRAFKSYRFYLDIKGKTPSSLIDDIINLGGVSLTKL